MSVKMPARRDGMINVTREEVQEASDAGARDGVVYVREDGTLTHAGQVWVRELRLSTPLDVWLRFDDPEDEEAAYEANTYRRADDDGVVVEWYHTAVGLVSSKWFGTYDEAKTWLENEGFQDFSS